MITNKKNLTLKENFRILLNALITACVAAGVIIFISRSNIPSVLSYFTIQSNLLCMIAAAVTLARVIMRKSLIENPYIFLKGMSLVSILLTFFIYNLVLKPFTTLTGGGGETLESVLLHMAVPVMMLLDFIFFEEKRRFKMWYPFGWTLFPVFYIGYTAVYKALGGTYKYFAGDTNFPYFFMDYETYGLKTVGLWILLIAAGYIGFSYLLIGFGRLISGKKR